MELRSVRVLASPDDRHRIRLSGDVAYDSPAGAHEEYWYEFPAEYEESLNSSGDPWLACLLPLAATLGEPLRLSKPVDGALLEGCREILDIWQCWHPHLRTQPIHADVTDPASNRMGTSVGLFFSGGMDSFSTLIADSGMRPERPAPLFRPPITDLISIWGFDVPLTKLDVFPKLNDDFTHIAAHFGKNLVTVATNVRQTRLEEVDWGLLAHGCVLAGVAHALAGRWNRAIISSSFGGYRNLEPWGSHPLTDRLLSSGRTRIGNEGAKLTRFQKTELVAGCDFALQYLRVCWKDQSERNCSHCIKCVRTMMMLDILGVLDRCPKFDMSQYGLARIAKTCLSAYYDFNYFKLVQEAAASRNRKDLVEAIDDCFRFSRRMGFWLPILAKTKDTRFLRRISCAIEKRLLTGAIR